MPLKKYAVIVAGGSGSRMGSPIPKQFLLLEGKPVLWHTMKVFLDAYADMEIILVLPQAHIDKGKAVWSSLEDPRRIRIVAGGATRFHSVQNGLSLIGEESIIFVHDGVRCLLTAELVQRCYREALRQGSAIPVIDPRDSIRLVTQGGNEAIDRSRIKLVQTPQTFLSTLLLPCYRVEYREHFTDEAGVVEAAGHRVQLVEGEPANIKITTAMDMVIAEWVLRERAGAGPATT